MVDGGFSYEEYELVGEGSGYGGGGKEFGHCLIILCFSKRPLP